MGTILMKKDNHLYKEINVWKRVDDNVLLKYRCFQVLPEGKYCVQNADFYRLPLDKIDSDDFNNQYLELLAQDSPLERGGKLYDSLEEAVSAHDADFQT